MNTGTSIKGSGNVNIVSNDEEITVRTPAHRAKQSIVLLGFLCLYVMFKMAQALREAINASSIPAAGRSNTPWMSMIIPVLLFLFLCWIFFQFARLLSGSHQVLRCTTEALEISRVDFGRVWYQRTFALVDVQKLAFGVYAVHEYGSTMGLRFEANNKTFKTLRGLKVIEANIILRKLESLGINVTHDPAMPMLIEMEAERRKSAIRWLS